MTATELFYHFLNNEASTATRRYIINSMKTINHHQRAKDNCRILCYRKFGVYCYTYSQETLFKIANKVPVEEILMKKMDNIYSFMTYLAPNNQTAVDEWKHFIRKKLEHHMYTKTVEKERYLFDWFGGRKKNTKLGPLDYSLKAAEK